MKLPVVEWCGAVYWNLGTIPGFLASPRQNCCLFGAFSAVEVEPDPRVAAGKLPAALQKQKVVIFLDTCKITSALRLQTACAFCYSSVLVSGLRHVFETASYRSCVMLTCHLLAYTNAAATDLHSSCQSYKYEGFIFQEMVLGTKECLQTKAAWRSSFHSK